MVSGRKNCPRCDNTGKKVKPVTLGALLKKAYASMVTGTAPQSREPGCSPPREDTGWRFCKSPDCDIVYFATQDDVVFTKDKLRVRVGIKETSGERLLCYCFNYSIAMIRSELQRRGWSDALKIIRQKMQAFGCRCEFTNPSGACCLGTIAQGIATARAELSSPPDS